MKQKMCFSHSAGSTGLSVWRDFGSHGVSEFFFFLAIHHCLSCPAHPPVMICFLGNSGSYCIQSSLPFLAPLCGNTSDLWC